LVTGATARTIRDNGTNLEEAPANADAYAAL